ncbi:MarR family winged helix-turn-helix transcriptional regulator [Streptomyces sp. NPDC096136]|uniref:MarR family winged helix-turn-helix transcriptional regulator n=1 Tax=Streptomyces sp. NPDC096136 TaxID=3366076 RepID=UPI0038058124
MEKDREDQDMVAAVVGQWEKERPDLAEALWPVEVLARIQRMNRTIDKYLKTFTADHGLEVGEFDVLASLRRSGPPYALTAGALIPAAMVTSGAITNRIDRLEAKGLVERVRDDADRRSVRIRLTDKGHTLIDAAMEDHLAHYARLLAPLDRETCDTVSAALRTLLVAHGDTIGPPTAS